MKSPRQLLLALLACAAIAGAGPVHAQMAAQVTLYHGICDGSAAVPYGKHHFVVTSDDRNVMLIYRRGRPEPEALVDMSDFLDTKIDKESDLEGAAQLGDRTYWISSHGRSRSGKVQQNRLRFFATRMTGSGKSPGIKPVGKPYAALLDDLLAAKHLDQFGLEAAARSAAGTAEGLNIEGLAATPEGKLLIGFRSPIIGGKALLIPLENPARVVDGKKAKFGAGILLDLAGRGIRSIDRVGSSYLIIAGPGTDDGPFALYQWNGRPDSPPKLVPAPSLEGLQPESLFAIPGTRQVQILSDDGFKDEGGKTCKDVPDEKKKFRSVTISY